MPMWLGLMGLQLMCTTPTQPTNSCGCVDSSGSFALSLHHSYIPQPGPYLLEAKKLNIPVVARADRTDVLAYLMDESTTSDRVDPAVFVPTVLGRAEVCFPSPSST